MTQLIIGIGNRFRRDDGIGPVVIDMIGRRQLPGWRLLSLSGEGAALIEHWSGCERVIIIDALRSGKPAGAIELIDANSQTVPTEHFHYSSHAFGLAEAVGVAKALDQLPRLQIIGVVGRDFSAGEELSPEISAVLPKVISLIENIAAEETQNARSRQIE